MKRQVLIIFIALILMLTFTILLLPNKKIKQKQFSQGINVLPTMNDLITNDSVWCGTFQLVWNDMKNEVVKQDIVFNPQITMVNNLNKEDFNENMLSKDFYYKIYGIKSKELKEKIEKEIKEKFNQESDILNEFDWDENPKDDNFVNYFFYVMLYKEFEFEKEFTKTTGTFKEVENVNFFGVENNAEMKEQIKVIFYNNENDFAISIQTKGNDEVILYKNPKGNTFNEIYENLLNLKNDFKGNSEFSENDSFKMPVIDFNVKREYDELANKVFLTYDNNEAKIIKAIQTITFSINSKGGKVKSEAAIDMKDYSAEKPIKKEKRKFYLDNTFSLFLKEKDKENPYLAVKIDDITKVQGNLK